MRSMIIASACLALFLSACGGPYSIAPNVPKGSTNAMNVKVSPGLTPVISWDGGPASVIGVNAADDADCKRPNGCWQIIGSSGNATISSPVTYGNTPAGAAPESDSSGEPLIKGHYYFIIIEGESHDKSVVQWAP